MMTTAEMNFRLVLLLWLLKYTSAQDANCDFYQAVAVGRIYYINSPGYPNYYRPGVQCRWIATCPPGYNCRLYCPEIRLPNSPSCSLDRLMISRTGDPQLNAADTYCTTGSLTAVSVAQTISVGLITSPSSPGGRFECQLTAQPTQPTPPPTPACRCGERRQNRIVGGQETGINEFTMMAGLVDRRISQIKCGGVIISALHVLTAAHCVENQYVGNYAVVVGEHDVTTGDSPARAYVISKFLINPGYNNVNYDNDIAIVYTAAPIAFDNYVQPVCLPFLQQNYDFAGSKVTVVGWGTIFPGGPSSNVPLKADLDVLSQSTCRSKVSVTDRQICTFTPGKDSCQDDSGGPLLWTNPNNGALYSVGIISYGDFCASNNPSINTRVTSFLNWIVQNTQSEAKYCKK